MRFPGHMQFSVSFTRQLSHTARSVHAVNADISCHSGQAVSPDLMPFATKPGVLHRILEVAKARRWSTAKDEGPTFLQMMRDIISDESARARLTNGQPSAAGAYYCTAVSTLCACHASTQCRQLTRTGLCRCCAPPAGTACACASITSQKSPGYLQTCKFGLTEGSVVKFRKRRQRLLL
jgi:hypothetical protein